MRTSQSHPLTVSLFKARQGFHRVLSDFAVLSLQVVTKWGPDEVSQWLESVGLPMYCHAFKEHEISGTELLSLERRDFKDVGVTKVSVRTRVSDRGRHYYVHICAYIHFML